MSNDDQIAIGSILDIRNCEAFLNAIKKKHYVKIHYSLLIRLAFWIKLVPLLLRGASPKDSYGGCVLRVLRGITSGPQLFV